MRSDYLCIYRYKGWLLGMLLLLLHLTGFRHKAGRDGEKYKDVTSESTFFPFHSQVSVTANSHFEEVWKITVFQGISASVSNWSWQTLLKPSCVNAICFTFLLFLVLSHTQLKVKQKHTYWFFCRQFWADGNQRGVQWFILKGSNQRDQAAGDLHMCRSRTRWLSRTHVEKTPPVQPLQVNWYTW